MKTALAVLVSTALFAQSLTLQIRVPPGDQSVRVAGARTAGVAVQVIDPSGKPFPGVAVTFRMPDEGPGGSFGDGLNSAIVTTGPDGRAMSSPIRWGPLSGVCEIRVTAAKNGVSTGTTLPVEISELKASITTVRSSAGARHSSTKWILIAAAIGAGAAVGLAMGGHGHSATSSGPAPVQIGSPTVTITAP
ncbi:MAG: hypothetical protein ABSG25_01235 [Bryobacteraceae bacterium]